MNDDTDAHPVDKITSALPVADVKMKLIKTEINKDKTLRRLSKNHYGWMTHQEAKLPTGDQIILELQSRTVNE